MKANTNVTLYEISAALNAVLAKLEEADGELPEGLEAELDAITESLADKIDGVLRARTNLVASAEGIDVEIKRLTALRDGYRRRADWLKQYVFNSMMATGQLKVQTKLFKLWIQKNGRPTVSLVGDAIPEQFKRTRVEFDTEAAYQQWVAWKNLLAAGDAEAAKGVELPREVRVILGSHLRGC